MTAPVRIAIVGDYDPALPSHRATDAAIALAADAAGIALAAAWVATGDVAAAGAADALAAYDGVWAAPGSPYRNLDGALAAIRYAREQGVPFIGTCGGFQHALLEYARNVLGIADAVHGEYDAAAPDPLITLSWCPIDSEGGTRLQGKLHVTIAPGSLAHRVMGTTAIAEEYHCNYELNPAQQPLFEGRDLRISGVGESGEARIIELAGARYFLATLFQPQRRPPAEGPHPLIAAFLHAAAGAP